MPRYLVERTLEPGWDVIAHTDGHGGRIAEGNGEDVTWLHSYVSDDGRRSFCLYEASSPEAIRRSASRNELPIDSITSVRVLDPYPYPRR